MTARWLSGRTVRVVTAALALAGGLIGAAPGAALAWQCEGGAQPPNPGSADNDLEGVALLPSCGAWAVGTYATSTAYETLIVRWNGTAWTQVPSPDPSPSANGLQSVAATSATNAWAVGFYVTGASVQTLIERWNGRSWKQVPSPNPSPDSNFLYGVAATSATNAWAVGETGSQSRPKTLIVHWNGTSWTQVPSPSPGPLSDILTGVAATSSASAWAVGFYQHSHATSVKTLIERWNGAAWAQVPSPNPAGSAFSKV